MNNIPKHFKICTTRQSHYNIQLDIRFETKNLNTSMKNIKFFFIFENTFQNVYSNFYY